MSIIDRLPEIKAIISWGIDKIPEEFSRDSRLYTWKNFLALGSKVKDDTINETIEKQRPG
jgi:hypothetical protein